MTEKDHGTPAKITEAVTAAIEETDIFAGSFETLYDMTVGYLMICLSSIVILFILPQIINPYLFIRSGAQLMCAENLFHNFITDPFMALNLLLSAGFFISGAAIHFFRKWGYLSAKFLFGVYALTAVPRALGLFDIGMFHNIFGGKGAPNLFSLIILLGWAASLSIAVYLTVRGEKRQILDAAGSVSIFATLFWMTIFNSFLFDGTPYNRRAIIEFTPLIFHAAVIFFGLRTIKKYYNSYE